MPDQPNAAPLFCCTHHSFVIEPWCGPSGVKVVQADDDEQVVLLLRDQAEVLAFTDRLRAVSFGGAPDA